MMRNRSPRGRRAHRVIVWWGVSIALLGGTALVFGSEWVVREVGVAARAVREGVRGAFVLLYAAAERERDAQLKEQEAAIAREAYLTLRERYESLVARHARLEEGPFISAGVIGAPPIARPYGTIVVDVGRQNGVKQGMVAFAGQLGVPVGTVDAVGQRIARVRLLTAAGMQLSGWVYGRGKASSPILLPLEGRGLSLVGEVPRDNAPPVGSLVWTGEEPPYPLGRVVRVEATPASPTVHIEVVPLFNPTMLSRVFLSQSRAPLPSQWWDSIQLQHDQDREGAPRFGSSEQ